jgi:hypothetical protein
VVHAVTASDQPPDGPEYSPVLGGPLYSFYLRTGLARDQIDRVRRRAIVIALIAWLPLLVLSVLDGSAWWGGGRLPFLTDIEANVRFLLVVPLLVVAEVAVHHEHRHVLQQLVARGIVRAEDRPRLERIVLTTLSLRNSIVPELLLLLFVLTIGHHLWLNQLTLKSPTWYATHTDGGTSLTRAGLWLSWVSIPACQFLLLRWYYRLALWGSAIVRVARLDLQLVPTHPDKAGGLGLLGVGLVAFVPLLIAQGMLLAGLLANRILIDGATLPAFKLDILGLTVALVLILLAPLFALTPQLVRTKLKGLRDYDLLAQRYVREFETKWLRGGASPDEAFMGSADIQSLADLGNSNQLVRNMRVVPFDNGVPVKLAIAVLAPILPLILTMIPLEEVIKRLVGVVF